MLKDDFTKERAFRPSIVPNDAGGRMFVDMGGASLCLSAKEERDGAKCCLVALSDSLEGWSVCGVISQ